MSTQRKPTVDDLYDRRYHNQPETGSLSMAELETVEAGRTALQSLHKTFDLWVAIGRAVVTLREKADRIDNRQAFKRLMAQNGFRIDGPPHEKVLDKGVVSKLEVIMKPENLPRVQEWYEKLPPKQKREWAAPTTVFKHCPVFAKPKPDNESEPKLTPVQQRDQIITKLEEENHQLRRQKEDERFTPTDTAANVARTLVGMFSPDKVKDIIRRAEALLKERTGKSGKTKTEAEPAPDVLQKAAEPVNAMLGELFNATLPKAKSKPRKAKAAPTS